MRDGRIDRTWRVSTETAERVNALAERLGRVSPSDLVDLMLIYALEAAEEGELHFEVRPTRYELVRRLRYDAERSN